MRWITAGLLMLVLLAGLAYAQGPDTVTLPDGEQVTVVQDLNRTIITLSNGVQVTRTQMGNNASSWGGAVNLSSADLDNAQKAFDLWLGQHPPARKRSGNPVAGILLIIVGGLGAAFPYAAWYLNVGWRFKDAEPSDAALIVARLGGGVAVMMGLFLLLT